MLGLDLGHALARRQRRLLRRFLFALGIPQVGESTAVDLARWLARRVRPHAYDPPLDRSGFTIETFRAPFTRFAMPVVALNVTLTPVCQFVEFSVTVDGVAASIASVTGSGAASASFPRRRAASLSNCQPESKIVRRAPSAAS